MSRCGICGHTVLDLHHCGECVDELRAALARETERAEKAERERDEARASDKESIEMYRRASSERDRLREQLAEMEERANELERGLDAVMGQRDQHEVELKNAREKVGVLQRIFGEECEAKREAERLLLVHTSSAVKYQAALLAAKARLAEMEHLGTGAGRRAG